MKILIQWAKASPEDWVEIDSSEWNSLPKRPEPVGGEVLDDQPGWIAHINVQGLVFTADHYHVEDLTDGSGGIRVTTWSDDPDDWTPEFYYADVRTIYPLGPDPELGGIINTRQPVDTYAGSGWGDRVRPTNTRTVYSWSAFIPPTQDVAHGIWVEDQLWEDHRAAHATCGYDEAIWCDHLDSEHLDADGRLGDRNISEFVPPLGTRTFHFSTTVESNPVDTATNEFRLIEDTPGSGTDTEGIGANGEVAWSFITISSVPADGDWPNGEYRCSINCTTLGSSTTFGLLTIEGEVGYFARYTALPSLGESITQDESAFSATGVSIATNTHDWSAGSTTDRLGVLIAAAHTGHGNQDMTITMGSSSFVDGPWVVESLNTQDAIVDIPVEALLASTSAQQSPGIIDIPVEAIDASALPPIEQDAIVDIPVETFTHHTAAVQDTIVNIPVEAIILTQTGTINIPVEALLAATGAVQDAIVDIPVETFTHSTAGGHGIVNIPVEAFDAHTPAVQDAIVNIPVEALDATLEAPAAVEQEFAGLGALYNFIGTHEYTGLYGLISQEGVAAPGAIEVTQDAIVDIPVETFLHRTAAVQTAVINIPVEAIDASVSVPITQDAIVDIPVETFTHHTAAVQDAIINIPVEAIDARVQNRVPQDAIVDIPVEALDARVQNRVPQDAIVDIPVEALDARVQNRVPQDAVINIPVEAFDALVGTNVVQDAIVDIPVEAITLTQTGTINIPVEAFEVQTGGDLTVVDIPVEAIDARVQNRVPQDAVINIPVETFTHRTPAVQDTVINIPVEALDAALVGNAVQDAIVDIPVEAITLTLTPTINIPVETFTHHTGAVQDAVIDIPVEVFDATTSAQQSPGVINIPVEAFDATVPEAPTEFEFAGWAGLLNVIGSHEYTGFWAMIAQETATPFVPIAQDAVINIPVEVFLAATAAVQDTVINIPVEALEASTDNRQDAVVDIPVETFEVQTGGDLTVVDIPVETFTHHTAAVQDTVINIPVEAFGAVAPSIQDAIVDIPVEAFDALIGGNTVQDAIVDIPVETFTHRTPAVQDTIVNIPVEALDASIGNLQDAVIDIPVETFLAATAAVPVIVDIPVEVPTLTQTGTINIPVEAFMATSNINVVQDAVVDIPVETFLAAIGLQHDAVVNIPVEVFDAQTGIFVTQDGIVNVPVVVPVAGIPVGALVIDIPVEAFDSQVAPDFIPGGARVWERVNPEPSYERTHT